MINKLDKKSRMLVEIIVFSLFISIISTSYAYFTILINGKSKNNVVESGSMMLSFEDGPKIEASNLLPGQTITKTFKVKNIGSLDTFYDVYFSDIINTFKDKNDLVYTLISLSGCSKTDENILPSSSGEKIVSHCTIKTNETQTYTLKILFKETDDNQNDNMGKIFSGKITINEYSGVNLAYLSDDELDNQTLLKINSIRSTSNTDISKRNGNIYYVSNDGNDLNTGLSEKKAFKTLGKINDLFDNNQIPDNSTILLRDGDVFRESLNIKSNNILIGSYGDIKKGKPLITTSPIDDVRQGNWIEVKSNIWKYTLNDSDQVFDYNVGEIWMFCDKENNNCTKSMSGLDRTFEYGQMITTNSDYDESEIENNIDSILTKDLEFYHVGHAYRNQVGAKALYLYSVSNPNERFDEIEFSLAKNGITYFNTSLYVDNISIKFAGNHGIGGGSLSNLRVTNCEIGFIGGSVQYYNSQTKKPVRFGNAIEDYGSVMDLRGDIVKEGFDIENNYIYQSYDSGPTFQLSAKDNVAHMEKAKIANNVLEYNNYNIEYWMASDATSGDIYDQSYIKDFLIENNILRYAGYGHCETRSDMGEATHMKTWYHKDGAYNVIKGNFSIRNNIFAYQKDKAYIFRSNKDNYPEVVNNAFYGNINDYFGYNSSEENPKNLVFDPNIINNVLPNNMVYVRNIELFNDDSGVTKDINWAFNSASHTLTIYGNGMMDDYSMENLPPWYKYRNSIYNIVVDKNVLNLGNYAFYNLRRVNNILINANSLSDLSRDESNVNYGNNYTLYNVGLDTFETTITFGEDVKYIPRMLLKPSADYNINVNFTNLKFLGNKVTTISNYGLAFYLGKILVLPEGVKNIASLSIGYNKANLIILPDSLNNITDWSINGNTLAEKVVFGQSIARVNEKVLGENNSLKEVVLPHIDNPNFIKEKSIVSKQEFITIYGDETTRQWINNMKNEFNINNYIYKPLSEYKSNITSNAGINGEVSYDDSFTFETNKNVKVYYIYTNSSNRTYKEEINYIRNNNTYTINNIKSDIYIELS